MNNRIKLRFTLLFWMMVTISIALSANNSYEKVNNNNGEEKDLANNSGNDIFELIFNEAKLFYVDALVSSYYNDTAAVKYCFDRVFEIMAEISELDSLTPIEQDDFNRFNEVVSNDYQAHFSYLIEETDSVMIVSIGEELFVTPLDTVDIGNDTLIIVEDRPGHIPIVRSKKIDRLIVYYSVQKASTIQKYLDASSKYREHYLPILKQYNVPEEIIYLPILESGYNPNAYSYAHAAGIWQFIPGTGAKYGLKRNWYVDERRDPIKSAHAAAKYLRKLYEEFDDWYLALAAYNCGENNVWRAIKREGTRDYFKLRSLPSQTRNYVPSFMAITIIAKDPEKYGFSKPTTPTWEWDEIIVDRCYELDAIAKACETSPDILREYNPELRRWMTPANDNQYVFRVPKGKAEGLTEKLTSLPEPKNVKPETIYHKVRKGENLSSIARKYGTSVSALVSANHLSNRNQLRVGQILLIPTGSYYSAPENKSSKINVITHTVQRGETLSEIAEKYNTSVSKIKSMNNIHNDHIEAGAQLKIPTDLASQVEPSDTPKGSTKVVHVVKKGDTLTSIANKYNVSLTKLKSWNDLDDRKPIYPGQRIIIYQTIKS